MAPSSHSTPTAVNKAIPPRSFFNLVEFSFYTSCVKWAFQGCVKNDEAGANKGGNGGDGKVEMAPEQVPRRPLQTRLGASSPSHENGVLCPCPSRYDFSFSSSVYRQAESEPFDLKA